MSGPKEPIFFHPPRYPKVEKKEGVILDEEEKPYSFDVLKDKNEIIFFGLTELGWDVQRWSPPINYFIKHNPNKKYIIVTLEDRIDLYKGYHECIPIKLEGLYSALRPGQYYVYGMDKKYEEIEQDLRKNYPKAYLCKAPSNNLGKHVFKYEEMDFDFQPRQKNKEVIKKIIAGRQNIITLAPRHRTDRDDLEKRNWKYWQELYNLLRDFTVLIAGSGDGYVRPNKKMDNCFCLEDYNQSGTSTIGLVIEGMKVSKVTIGQQSGNPLLSLQLGIPVISWGHEKHRHTIDENPRRTPCVFFDGYEVDPQTIYEAIK